MREEFAQLSSQVARLNSQMDAVLARLPDVSGAPVRRQIAVGLALSLALHVLLFAILIGIALAFPEPPRDTSARPRREQPPEPEPLNIQLVTKPKPTPEEAQRTKLIDRRGMEASKDKPKNPEFESDEDMKAGSEAAPTGLLPLPSQDGRTDRNTADFATENAAVGAAAALPWPQLTVQPKPAPAAPASEPPPPPAAEPLYTPNPVAKEALAAASKAAPTDKLPDPSKQVSTPPPRLATATPKPRKAVVMPREDEIAVAVATPRPPAATAEPRESVPGRYAMLSTPAPISKQSFTKRYQEMLEKTRVEGSINNRGKAGVDAVATPFGRYWGQVKTAIGSGWNRYVNEQMTLIAPGTARVSFVLDRQGRASNVRVDANTSNASFANVCERAVRDAPLPPIPPDVVSKLRDGQLEYSIVFTFYTF